MAFSEDTKRELARIIPQERCCRIAELSAYYDFNGYLFGDGKYLDFYHFTPLIARKILTLVKSVFPEVQTQVLVHRAKARKNQVYTIRVQAPEEACTVFAAIHHQEYADVERRVLTAECCRRAYVRGAFLGHGSVTNPRKTYHLEIFTEKYEVADKVLHNIKALGLDARMTTRKGDLLVYLKDGDEIVTLLNLMGAHSALMQLENVRVAKDMRNRINRLVNCETANVEKTIQAAVEQIDAVEKIQKHMPLSDLPPKLAEIAVLRIENPYATLKELGEMANPPISKSGVNYRLQQLIKLSKSLG